MEKKRIQRFLIFMAAFVLLVYLRLNNNDEIKCGIDAIVVLGGGRPISKNEPPAWVSQRAQTAATLYHSYAHCHEKPKIVALSAGSAHVPQLIDQVSGLPVFESAATARYLVQNFDINAQDVSFETSSYDTIGNAFYFRAIFAEINGWKNFIVITSNSHMSRTKAIFDFVFDLPSYSSKRPEYSIDYVSTLDIGINPIDLELRISREHKSLQGFLQLKETKKFKNLKHFHEWLTTKHKMYSATYLDEEREEVSTSLKRSYGLSVPNS